MALSLEASVLKQGDALVLRQQEGGNHALVQDFGLLREGDKLPGGMSIVNGDPKRLEMLTSADLRPRYMYVDVMVITGLAEAEVNLGDLLSLSAGVESGALVVSVGVEVGEETLIDVGEARYVRKTALQEGVLIEQDVEELRIPRELRLTLEPTGWLRIEAKADTVRGEAAGLPEVARTEYSTVSYVDEDWRVVGTLTDRQTGMFLSFSESAASIRGRHRGRSSVLVARVSHQREVVK